MDTNEILKNIGQRCNGDIYLGVVGPVRTGKSTFIRRFMENMVIPNIMDEFEKKSFIKASQSVMELTNYVFKEIDI